MDHIPRRSTTFLKRLDTHQDYFASLNFQLSRVKLLKDAPYSQAEADAAAGLQKADTKPKKKEVAMDTTEA